MRKKEDRENYDKNKVIENRQQYRYQKNELKNILQILKQRVLNSDTLSISFKEKQILINMLLKECEE